MADTFSQFMQLLLMQDGSHPNTWGQLTNTNLSLIDQAMSQVTSIAVSNTNFTLTNFPAAQSQARSLAFNVTGTLSAPVAIQLPSGYPRLYVFFNQVTNSGSSAGQFPLTVQNGVGTALGATVALTGPAQALVGVANLVYTDGTNCYGATPPGSFAHTDQYTAWSAGFLVFAIPVSLTGGPVYTGTIDTSKSNEFYVTAPAGATSITMSVINSAIFGEIVGHNIQVAVTQNSSGGTSIFWPSNILWPNGVVPTFSTAPNATDLVTLTYTNVGGTPAYLARIDQNYGAAGSTGSTYNVRITQSGVNLTLLSLLNAQPVGAVTVNVTVNPGVIITAQTTSNFALDLQGLPSGSVINLFNNGYIAGAGGAGGPSQFFIGGVSFGWGEGSPSNPSPFAAGQPGGAAINGPGAGRTLNVFNTNGHIWGGGGGGGGGGITVTQPGVHDAVAGAGGGGAGFGPGGQGFTGGDATVNISAASGTTGGVVPNPTAGGAATAGASHGTASAGSGGAGGNWGAAGANGTSATGDTVTYFNGNGGAAGAAITASGTINLVQSGDIQGST